MCILSLDHLEEVYNKKILQDGQLLAVNGVWHTTMSRVITPLKPFLVVFL